MSDIAAKMVVLATLSILGVSGQTKSTTTTTTRSPIAETVKPLDANEALICQILKPPKTQPFMKGDGGYSLKLSFIQPSLVNIEINANTKDPFIGKFVLKNLQCLHLNSNVMN